MQAFKKEEQAQIEADVEGREKQSQALLQDVEFSTVLNNIDASLIDMEEESVVPFMMDNFQKYGFTFEETGMGDAMTVTTADGKETITIDLDPFLSKTEVLESKKLKDFIISLEETMLAGPPGSVGIAAPQVGCGQRIVIVDVSCKPSIKNHGRLVMINPEITSWEGFVVGREGCMSVPDFTGNVIRAERIMLEASDEHGQSKKYEMEGYEARAVQHEIDHLDGLLFLDRLVSRRNDLFRRKK